MKNNSFTKVDTEELKLDNKELELIEAARNGDQNAFRVIVETYERKVAATVFGMLGNRSETEDIGQETFVRFYKSLKHFKCESTAGTYIIRIAINLSLNELKRRKRRSFFFHYSEKNAFELENVPDNTITPDCIPEKDELNNVVQQAIGQLNPKFRSVIVLRLIDGYSTQETAEILNLPIGTILSRLARAQLKLKKILEPYIVSGNLYKNVKR